MPIYEYRCEDCGELSEILQRMDDPPLEACPQCQGTVKKLISAPAFQFKGTGWYVTDYARNGASDGASEATAKEGEGGAKTGSETASKEAASKEVDAGGGTGADEKAASKSSAETKGATKSGGDRPNASSSGHV